MNRKIGAILSYVLMFFEICSTLFLTPFLISTLGDAEYGIYKLSSAIVSYLLLLDLGIGNAVVRYIAKFRVENNFQKAKQFLGITTIFYLGVALLTVIIGVVLINIYPIAFAVGLNSAEIIIGQKLLALSVANAAITLGTTGFCNTINGYERFDITKGWSIIQIIIRMIGFVVVLKAGLGSVGILEVNLFLTIILKGSSVLFVIFRLKLRPLFSHLDKSFIKEIFTYSSFVLLQMIATQINAFADEILIGSLVEASSVLIAVYGVGHQISEYFQSFGSAINGILMPGIVQLMESKPSPQKICSEMVRIGRIIFMFVSLVFCGFVILGKDFIILWVGEEKIVAYYIAIILMVVNVFILTESVGSQILWAINQHKEQSVIKIIIVVINVFLTILLIRWNALIGASIGTAISLLLGDVVAMNVVFVKKLNLNIKAYYIGLFKGLLPVILLTALVGFAISLLPINGYPGLILKGSAISAVYAGLMWLFGLNSYEKNLFKSILSKFIRIKKVN